MFHSRARMSRSMPWQAGSLTESVEASFRIRRSSDGLSLQELRAVSITAASRKSVGTRLRAKCILNPAVTAVAPLERSPVLYRCSRNNHTSAALSSSLVPRSKGSLTWVDEARNCSHISQCLSYTRLVAGSTDIPMKSPRSFLCSSDRRLALPKGVRGTQRV